MVCIAGNDLICRIKDVESGEQCFLKFLELRGKGYP